MASKYHRTLVRSNPATQRFIFATGIECSYPTVADPGRREAPRPAGGVRALRPLARRPAAHRGPRRPHAALRPAVVPHAPGARPLRLGVVRTRCSPRCGAWGSCPSSTCATSGCRTGWAASRTRSSPGTSPPTPGPSPSATPGCASTRRSTRCTSPPSSAPTTAGGTSAWPPTGRSSRRSSTSCGPTWTPCWPSSRCARTPSSSRASPRSTSTPRGRSCSRRRPSSTSAAS